jgi:hypothetical protein
MARFTRQDTPIMKRIMTEKNIALFCLDRITRHLLRIVGNRDAFEEIFAQAGGWRSHWCQASWMSAGERVLADRSLGLSAGMFGYLGAASQSATGVSPPVIPSSTRSRAGI